MIGLLLRSTFSRPCSLSSSSVRRHLVQICHFSNFSNYHSPRRRQEYEFQNEPVSVWWNLENCNVPSDVNVHKIAHRITEAVRSEGIMGLLQITAFGDFSRLQRVNKEALSSSGINLTHVPNGGKNIVDSSLFVDLMCWVSQNPPPAHLFMIFGDEDFAEILHRLRMKKYNILLASPDMAPNVLCSAATITWHWNSLLKGEYLPGKHYNQPPDSPLSYWYGHYKVPLEDTFSNGQQSTCSQIEEPELSNMKLTIVSHSEEPRSSELKQTYSQSVEPKLSELKQNASHSKELGLSKPRQMVDHSREAELFSSSSFWSYLECYFFSTRIYYLLATTRSRKDLMFNFQKFGPPILSSLSENDLLKVADLIISDKKWVVERPSPYFFRDNSLDHFVGGLKLTRDRYGKLELLSNSYFWSDMKNFIFSAGGESIITQSSCREEMISRFSMHDSLALAFFDVDDLLKVADMIISDKKWVVERPSQKFPLRLSSPFENPIPNDRDKDEQGNENASNVMTDKKKRRRKGWGVLQICSSSLSHSRWFKNELEALFHLEANFGMWFDGNRPKPNWEEISCEMKTLGYDRSANACKEKWVNMNKYFERMEEKNKRKPEHSQILLMHLLARQVRILSLEKPIDS